MGNNNKIKVLIVDDSFFMRNLLSAVLSSDQEISIVGTAKDGLEAIEKVKTLAPDIITMDLRMPGMDGCEAIKKIMEITNNTRNIIMVSAFTREGAQETLICLRAGAVDFILKPSGEISLDIDKVKEELIKKIKIAYNAQMQSALKIPDVIRKPEKNIKNKSVDIVVIGASTGGPKLIEEMLPKVPSNINFSIIIAQHMPKHFTESFAKHLSKISKIKVFEASDGQEVERGCAYVAPGEYDSRLSIYTDKGVARVIFKIVPDRGMDNLTPSINEIMKSAALTYGSNVIGVILTGMGNDGEEGSKEIKKRKGYVIAQDPEECAVSSMPLAVIKKGLTDEILESKRIIKRILDLAS